MAFKIMFLGYRFWIFIEELPRHLRETRNWKLETRRSIAEISWRSYYRCNIYKAEII